MASALTVQTPISAVRSTWEAFRAGLATPWTGFLYMCRRPALWRFGVVPIVLNLFITGLVLGLLIAAGIYFFSTIHPKFGEGWLWLGAEVLTGILLLVVVLGLAVLAWVFLQGILCGHFYGKLAEQVELQLGTRPGELKSLSFSQEVGDTVRDVGFVLLVNAGCLVIQIIPVIGSVIGLVGSYYFSCHTLGMEYFEYSLSLRGARRDEKRTFGRKHRPYVLGLGTAAAVLTLLPVANAILLTTAVTGAVLLHRQLRPEGGTKRAE